MSTYLTLQVSKLVEAGTYTTLPASPLLVTSDLTEKRAAVGKDGKAFSIKFTQSGGSYKTEIYAVELDVRGYPAEVGPAQ